VLRRQNATSVAASVDGSSCRQLDHDHTHLVQVVPDVLHHLLLELALPAVSSGIL
jgi:hypothetical protein